MSWNAFKTLPATMTLVLCQTLLFIIEISLCESITPYFHISPDVLITLGALVHSAPLDPLHLTSATFLHADCVHFLFNLVTLYSLIRAFETHRGTKEALISFISAGIISNVVSFLYHHQGITIGASGALVAMATALLLLDFGNSWGLTSPMSKSTSSFPSPTSIRLQSFFTLGTSLMPSLFGGAIDYAAHLGGVIAGLLLWLCFLIQPLPALSK